MVDKKYQRVLFSFFTALLMSGIMSLSISVLNLGLIEDLVSIWLRSWGFSFAVAFPLVFIVSPMVTLLVKYLIIQDI